MDTGTLDIRRTTGAAPSPWRPVALGLTNLLSPPVLIVAGAGLLAAPHGSGAMPATLAYLAAAVIAPLGVLAWLLRRGAVSDPDIVQREQRLIPMIVAVAGLAVGWELTGSLDAPGPLKVMAAAQFCLGLLLLAVTLQWKISVHTAQAAVSAVLLSGVAADGWLLGALVALTAVTRLALRRHTPAQTVAGAAAGLAVGFFFLRSVQGG